MKICVIGCGYVGRAAASLWKAHGHHVTVTTRSLEKSYALRPFADLVYIFKEDWGELVEKQDVILLSVAPDDQSDYIQTYLRTAETLVGFLKGSSVSQIIYTGSTSIYGEHDGQWVDEETLPRPANSNGHILLATEQTLLKAALENRKVCIFRLGEIYGPGRSIVERIKRLQGTSVPGSGESWTNLVHLDEITSALDLAVQKGLDGVYNLCNDIHIQRKDLYNQICEAQGLQRIQWNPSIVSPHAGNKKVSNTKLKFSGWRVQKWSLE